jgi:hypothetical protein
VTVTWSEPPIHLTGFSLSFDVPETYPNSTGTGGSTEMEPETVNLGTGATSYTTNLKMNLGKDLFSLVAEDSTATVPYDRTSFAATVQVPLELAPEVPRAIAVAGNKQVTLQWSDDEALDASDGIGPITGYEVFQGTKPGQEATVPIPASRRSVKVTTLGDGWSSVGVTVDDLSAGTTYYFEVTQADATGPSPSSQEVSATPPS